MARRKSPSSSEALHKLEEQLTCSICLEQYKNPRILPCFHSFCLHCLEDVQVEVTVNGEHSITCPACRAACLLPKQGLRALPVSFTINNLAEVYGLLKKVSGTEDTVCDKCGESDAVCYRKQCARFLCQKCLDHHNEWITTHQTLTVVEITNVAERHQLPNPTDDNEPSTSPSLVGEICVDHYEPFKVYCDTCDEIICQLCTVKKHRDHEYDVITDVFSRHKDDVNTCLQTLSEIVTNLSKALGNLMVRRTQIATQGEAVKKEIRTLVANIIKLLHQTETSMCNDVDNAVKYKLNVTDHQKLEAETVLKQVTERKDQIEQCLRVGTPQQILLNKSRLTKQAKEAIENASKKSFQPLEQANIKLKNPKKPTKGIISRLGSIQYSFSPSKVSMDYAHTPVAGQISEVTLNVFNSTDSLGIKCDLKPPGSKKKMNCVVKQVSPLGKYLLTFMPTVRGNHRLIITVNEKTPSVELIIPVTFCPSKPFGKIAIGLCHPTGIALHNNFLFVCEEDSNCIAVIDNHGKKVRTIGGTQSGNIEIKSPNDIAVTPKGTLLVTEWRDNRIREISLDGKTSLKCIGSKGNGPLQFDCPCSIVMAYNKVFLTDIKNHRVQVLNSDLYFSYTFGSIGVANGQFNTPCGINVDSKGYVYVSDSGNDRVQKFTSNGMFVSILGSKGPKPGQLTCPLGIAIDENDLLFVCEGPPNSRVSVFTTDGVFVHCFGQSELTYPSRAAFDKNGYLYVSDYDRNVVIVF